MVSIKLYLDCRVPKANGTSPLKIAISSNRKTRYVPLGIFLLKEHWDGTNYVVTADNSNARLLNLSISRKFVEAEAVVLKLEASQNDPISLDEYVDAISYALNGKSLRKRQPKVITFVDKLMEIANSPSRKESTRQLYRNTLARLKAFNPAIEKVAFEEIDKAWLIKFDEFLAQTAPSKNYRNIHLRNIRTVFNAALDDEIITCYPFRRFKIRPVPTRKRALSVEKLRELFTYPVEDYAIRYVDYFKLIFCLCGINVIDLCNLTEIHDGRIEYTRAKTGRLYSIKVEPEAMAIIEKYRGKKFLLDVYDSYADHRDYIKKINKALQRIGPFERRGLGGKKIIEPLFPGLTSYWARHTWATIAASLDIPKETIAAALGHGGNTVTDIYIDFDQRKIDEANRRVLDWVFYSKK